MSPIQDRWTSRRKAAIVVAIQMKKLTPRQARARYEISEEELRSWVTLYEKHGLRALNATRLQEFRRSLRRVGR